MGDFQTFPIFFLLWSNTDKGQLKRKRVYYDEQFKVQFNMSEEPRQNEFEVACHIATTVKKQTAVDTLIPFSICDSNPSQKRVPS